MKISRKMQQQVEMKIRHAMATGPLPHIERGALIHWRHRHDAGKTEGHHGHDSKSA